MPIGLILNLLIIASSGGLTTGAGVGLVIDLMAGTAYIRSGEGVPRKPPFRLMTPVAVAHQEHADEVA
jgi:hypothetical protein